MSITEACVRRPILAWVIMTSVTLLGGLTLARLGVTDRPEYVEPQFTVTAGLPGTSPEQMENGVVTVIEDALAGVQGVDRLESSASQGSAQVTVHLRAERKLDDAINETQQRLAAAQWRFPRAMRPPVVSKGHTADEPVAYLMFDGAVDPRQLSHLATTVVRPALQAIPGIADAAVYGTRERQVRIWLDPHALWDHNLTAHEVRAALQREHVPAAGGSIENAAGMLAVEVASDAPRVASLAALPLKLGAPGKPAVTLADVGVVQDGFADASFRVRFNGAPAAIVAVTKQRGSNVVALADEVQRAVARLNAQLPAGVHLRMAFDLSTSTREHVHALIFELVLAIAITGLCCRVFLGSWQSTLNVFLAIPMSLLGACSVLYACGFTLNEYTMLGLTIAVGIVVDDAIMVLESIDREHRAGGDPITAAVQGTRRISLAAPAATLGVVCIFAPVMLMQGRTGRNFLELGVALSVAVVLSYVEAVTLAPARCAQMMARASASAPHGGGAMSRFETRFGGGLARCLRHPWRTLAATLLVCAAGLAAFAWVPEEGAGASDSGVVSLLIDAPVEYTSVQTEELARAFEAKVRGLPAVDKTVFLYGAMGDNQIMAHVMLKPADARSASTREVAGEIYATLAKEPLLRAHSYGGGALTWTLRSTDWLQLRAQAQRMQAALRADPRFAGVTTQDTPGPQRLVLVPDRAALADAHVPMEAVTATVSMLFSGADVGWFDLDGHHADIRLRLAAPARASIAALQDITVRASGDKLMPLGALVHERVGTAPLSLTRRDRQRSMDLSAQLASGADPGAARAAVQALAAQLPEGVQLAWEGETREQGQSHMQLLLAMVLGVIFAYLVLAAQLNSVALPVLVLSSIPMAAAGAGVTLWARGLPLGEVSLIGLLLLFGLVKKNAIMLVDCAVDLRNQGMSHLESAATAAQMRLRPILMTTCATLVAVLPAALAVGPGGAQRMGMAWVVLGGLVSSTLLSLVAVPCVLSLRRLSRRRAAGSSPAATKRSEMK